MLGLGSYTFRWSIGHKGLNPEKPMTPFDLLDIAQEHQLGVVQFADNMPLGTLSTATLVELKAHADKLGIQIEIGTQSFDVEEVTQYIQIAKILDARILRVALDGIDAEKTVPDLAKEFRQVLPACVTANVRIAIENHFNFPAPRMVALLKEINSEQVGVCLDVANSICAGEWPSQTVQTLAAYTINLHLKDYLITPDAFGVGFIIQGCPLGQGRTDCADVLSALPNNSGMNIILEHWLPQSQDMNDARAQEHRWLTQSVAFARNQLNL